MLAVVLLTGRAWLACSSFSATPTSAVDDAAVTVEASVDAAPDTGIVAHTGALVDDHFEALVGCDGWQPIRGATTTSQAPGHTGARSCQLCGTDMAGMTKTVPFDGRGAVETDVFLRSPDTGAPIPVLTIIMRSIDGPVGGNAAFNPVIPTTDWKSFPDVLPAHDADASTLAIELDVTGGDGGCVLVDDITVTKL